MKSEKKMVAEKVRKDGGKTVMVVLDGVKVSSENSGGLVPLCWGLRDVVVAKGDKVLVLVIFNLPALTPSPETGGICCLTSRDNKTSHSSGGDNSYLKFLRGEIRRKTQDYLDIFQPFYDECKSNGVKFVVKMGGGHSPKAIIVKIAKHTRAAWIVMNRSFADDNGFQLSEITHKSTVYLDLESDYIEGLVVQNSIPPESESESSLNREDPKLSKLKTKEEPHICCTLPLFDFDDQHSQHFDHPSTSKKCENLTQGECCCSTSMEVSEDKDEVSLSSQLNSMSMTNNSALTEKFNFKDPLGMPLKLSSWEVISEITSDDQNESFKMFLGHLPEYRSQVIVRSYTVDFDSILEAEKRVALSMYHKNIMRLIAYHQTENTLSLVFPCTMFGPLERFLCETRGTPWKLTFAEKMSIAIGIGQGLRYMHEDCPQCPVIHGDLRISNIFLRQDLRPQITGFGNSFWPQQEQSSQLFNYRYEHEHRPDSELMKLMKSDVFSFGILLLRLVCRKNIPQDDRTLVNWAQPLLSSHAYHEMLEEEMEYPDMLGILRIMSAAAQCIKYRHSSRPLMSEVVSYLKGETTCDAQESPSLSEGSGPNVDLRNMSSVIRC